MSETLDVRRSISEVLDTMGEEDRVRWFELNSLEPGAGLEEAIEQALDDGVDADDVLASLVEAMMADE